MFLSVFSEQVDMSQEMNIIQDVGTSIVTAFLVALPAYFLKIPMVLAYLFAGVLLGKSMGLGIVTNPESIHALSEFGLIFLMFILGIEIDIKKLRHAGKLVIVNGIVQFLGCAGLAVVFFYYLGIRNGHGNFELIYFAVATSLSSTLVVVKILSDRMELDSLTSRITLGVLVIQDLWAIMFLAFQPNLSKLEPTLVFFSLFKIILLISITWFIARYILGWIFAQVAKHSELMLLCAVGWCAGIVGLAQYFHLSGEMGALVAGVAIASYPYHLDIASRISSLRDFFVTLFFVTLGLKIPMPDMQIFVMSLAIVFFVICSRMLTLFPTIYLLGYGNRVSFIPAVNLAQLSEFSLVVTSLGVGFGHISKDVMSAFTIALVLSLMISSVAMPFSFEIYKFFNPLLIKLGLRDHAHHVDVGEHKENIIHKKRIILLGFFKEASSLLSEIQERNSEEKIQEILVVDFNPETIRKLRSKGINCLYADLSNTESLKNLSISAEDIILCTINDSTLKGTSNLKLLHHIRKMSEKAVVVLTSETIQNAREMYKRGADYVIIPRLVTSYYLADVIEGIEYGRRDIIREGAMHFIEKREEILK